MHMDIAALNNLSGIHLNLSLIYNILSPHFQVTSYTLITYSLFLDSTSEVSAGLLLVFIINKLKFKLYQPVKPEIRQITTTSIEVHTVKNGSFRSVSIMNFEGCDAAKKWKTGNIYI